MKTLLSVLSIILLWALIYLTGLGRREIRGEEWRRTLPGRTMLNTGQWLVPFSGGQPFVRKPPLINWASAASFHLTGEQTEWSARLPSTLAMLGAALLMYGFGRRAIGQDAALLGTVCFLTLIGCVEKGRLAEIEVYYISFTGAAFVAWLAGFLGRANRWLSWLVTGVLLGLGLLAKGPMHLLFFYLLVLGVCWQTRRWREIFSLPHLVGLLAAIGIALAWVIPFIPAFEKLPRETNQTAIQAWLFEVSSRVTGEEETSIKDWLVRGPRALTMFLPWILFLPLAWNRERLSRAMAEANLVPVFRGTLFGALAGFAIMVLLPSSSPRYVAPLLGPVAMLCGWALALGLADGRGKWLAAWQWLMVSILAVSLAGLGWFYVVPTLDLGLTTMAVATWVLGFSILAVLCVWTMRRRGSTPSQNLIAWTSLAMAAAIGCYGMLTGVYVHTDHLFKPMADKINQAMVPKDGPLCLFHLGQIPYPFYLPTDTFELDDPNRIPDSGIKWMLTTPRIYQDWHLYFERRYGKSDIRGEYQGTWGEESAAQKHYVLVRFAGR